MIFESESLKQTHNEFTVPTDMENSILERKIFGFLISLISGKFS